MAQVISGQFAALSNGVRLHYASAGERGRPLMLFVHGFPEAWFEWQEQLEVFGDDYFAVAPDLRGFNLSSQPKGVENYRPRHIVEDLSLLVAHLGYAQCFLVAHDWGGAIAWNVAIFRPELVEHLVIINAPHPYQFMRELARCPEQRAASAYMNWLREPGSESALVKDDFQRLDGMFTAQGQATPSWFDAHTRARYHEMWAMPGADGAPAMQGAVNYYRASPLHPPKDAAEASALAANPLDWRVKVPTDVIWGEQDVALRVGLLEGLELLCDDLQLTRIPEGSHWVIHEQPQRISQLVRAALARRQ